MGRAESATWLSIDRWATIMGINPLSFNQLFSTLFANQSFCGEVWFQEMWQNTDQVSREALAEAIAEAEERIMAMVGYNLLPDWTADERVKTVRPARPELFASTVGNLRGQLKSVTSRWNYLISGGQRVKTLIDDLVAVVFTDPDGDGYAELATATVTAAAISGLSECEIHLYFPGESGADEWEIRPITVSITGTTATITFRRWQLVDPDLQSAFDAASIDGDVAGNYLTQVDVFRVFNDPQTMAQLLWEIDNDPVGCATCSGAGCQSCAFRAQTGCLHIRDERLGHFAYTPATWDATNEIFNRAAALVCRDPDQLRIWYYSGYQSDHPRVDCPRVELDPFWEKTIAYYAAALLDRPLCSCNNTERFVDYWREDLSRTGREVAHQVSPSDLDNPFGTMRGGVEAWRKINGPNSDWIVKR